ncbi:transcriptional repressor LexA [candidate division KSB1 bacterium]|nr:transcriptional repressor LexA [candidate division KSB1 bacterium]
MTRELTEKQAEMLRAIKEWITENGYPPTVRDLQEVFNFASVNAVHKVFVVLEKKGFLRKKQRGSARGYEVVGWKPFVDDRVKTLPLVGQIAAGPPIVAYENVEDYIPIDVDTVGVEGDFALRVKGNSMIDAGIQDGDIVIIQQTNTCANGEIAVALLNDEATVKRLYKETNRYRLQPENPELKPRYIAADDPNFRIIGKVKALIRRY